MILYQMSSLNLNTLTQQGIVQRINDSAKNLHTPLQGNEFYDGKFKGTLDTPDKVKLHLVRMGAGGDGAYAHLLLNATKLPQGLSEYLPDDNVARGLQKSLPIADFSREQPNAMPQINMTNGKPQDKKYHRNAYTYAKYARIQYLKSAAKVVYGKVETQARNAMAKIRSVYQSSKGFLRGVKEYKGQDSKSNVVSFDAYKAAREHIKYAAQNGTGETLEQRIA